MTGEDVSPKKIKLDLQQADEGDQFNLFKAYKEGRLATDILDSGGDRNKMKPGPSGATTGASPPIAPVPGPCPRPAVRPVPQQAASVSSRTDVQTSAPTKMQVSSTTATAATTTAAAAFGSGNAILVNPCQRGNPVLKSIRNVAWQYNEMEADYVLGRNACALYLSLRYHNLNPDYIHERLRRLRGQFELRVLLVQIDVKDPHHPLKELCKLCIASNMTLVLAWSCEEAGRYLETYKAFEHKPPDSLQQPRDLPSKYGDRDSGGNSHVGRAIEFLTGMRAVNRTDAAALLSMFGSVNGVMEADRTTLEMCPGFGANKARRLYDTLRLPFLKSRDGSQSQGQ